jgi:hypothetical protein
LKNEGRQILVELYDLRESMPTASLNHTTLEAR